MANLVRALLRRPLLLPVQVGVGICSFQFATTNFLQRPYFLGAAASGVDCSAFICAVAVLSVVPVVGVRGFCGFFLAVANTVNLDRVFLCSA